MNKPEKYQMGFNATRGKWLSEKEQSIAKTISQLIDAEMQRESTKGITHDKQAGKTI